MEPITNELVFRIEQAAWQAAGGVGQVDTLPTDTQWMEATAEAVDVPVRVVEAIVGDMKKHTTGHRQMPQRGTGIGAAVTLNPKAIRPGLATKGVINKGETLLIVPIRCKCRARITVVPCRTCGWVPPRGVEKASTDDPRQSRRTRRRVARAAAKVELRRQIDEVIGSMIAQGISTVDIAREMKVSRVRVRRVAREMWH